MGWVYRIVVDLYTIDIDIRPQSAVERRYSVCEILSAHLTVLCWYLGVCLCVCVLRTMSCVPCACVRFQQNIVRIHSHRHNDQSNVLQLQFTVLDARSRRAKSEHNWCTHLFILSFTFASISFVRTRPVSSKTIQKS